MDNIEKSEIMIARILSKALEFGLQSASLEFEELELDASYAPFFATCIEWLIHEDLIRAENHVKYLSGTSDVLGITLTSYGFSVLGQKVAGLDEEILIRDAVQKVSETQSGYTGVGDFIGGILGGFTKSISS